MPMDPQVEALRRQRRADRVPPLYEMSPQEARIADLADIRAGAGTPAGPWKPGHLGRDLPCAHQRCGLCQCARRRPDLYVRDTP